MKTRFSFLFLILCGTQILLLAQDQPFTARDSVRNDKRWRWHQPYVQVFLINGDTLEGQPIHFDMDTLALFPSGEFPLLKEEEDLIRIPFGAIDSLWIDRGGRITMAQTSGIIVGIGVGTGLGLALYPVLAPIFGSLLGVGGGFAGVGIHRSSTTEDMKFNPPQQDYLDDLKLLRLWSVFPDSVVYLDDLRRLPGNSPAARRAFPKKHLRISLSPNLVLSLLEGQVQGILEESDLPSWQEFYTGYMRLEFIDLSWRMRDHWIVGMSLIPELNRGVSAYYYYGYDDASDMEHYNYGLMMSEYVFYMEYAFGQVDRFFQDRDELLLGAGLIYGKSDVFFYGVWHGSDQDEYIYQNSIQSFIMPGLQMRASYHYYLARNFSISAGAVLDLYPDLKVREIQYPQDHANSGEVLLKSHRLNNSNLRFRVGAHLYF